MKISTRPLEIIDTTLRDGLQSPLWDDYKKFYPTLENKLNITEALMRYGIRFFEVFSPVVSSREAIDLTELLLLRDRMSKEIGHKIYFLVHARCHPKDIEESLKHNIDGLNLYMGTSPQSRDHNHGKNLEQIVSVIKPLLEDLRKNRPDLLLRFSGEDAFRTDLKDLFTVYDEVADLVDRLGTPDTVGISEPEQVTKRIKDLKARYPKMPLEGHFHNDRGFSLINAVSAIKAGMGYMNTSLLGLAERSGITSLTALMLNLSIEKPPLCKGYNLELSYPLNVLMSDILNIQVPSTEPVSLTNRTHSAGVHSQAVRKDSSVYEANQLEKFGVAEQRLLLNSLSGKHIIKYFLTEVLNFMDVTEEIAEQVTKLLKNRSSEINSDFSPSMLLEEISSGLKLSRLSKPVSHVEDYKDKRSPHLK